MFNFFKKPLDNKPRGNPKKPRPRVWYCPDGTRALFQAWIMVKTNYRIMQTITETIGAEAG